MPKKPTLKQQKAAEIAAKKIAAEKGGKGGKSRLSKADILREAEYSDKVVDNPDRVFGSKGFKELIDQFLPEELLLEKTAALINAEMIIKTKKITHLQSGEDTIEVLSEFSKMDSQAVSKGLDMGHKIRGLYAAQKVQLIDPMDSLDDDEIDAEILKFEKERAARLKQKTKTRGRIKDEAVSKK